ncbi:MAG: hypothetical protein FWD83_07285 [Promicromonosporaceae bacterium]|nr:hypothetical protein [Promicromonosporaceae bacterium]
MKLIMALIPAAVDQLGPVVIFPELLVRLLPILPFIAVLVGSLAVGAWTLVYPGGRSFWQTGIVLVCVGLGGFVLSLIVPRFMDDDELEIFDPPTLSPVPSPALSESHDSMVESGVSGLQVLVNLGIGLCVLAVVAGVYFGCRRLRADRRRALEARAIAVAAARRVEADWETIRAKHHELRRQYLDSETDWDTLFELPALSDASVPTTAVMLRAMKVADEIDDTMPVGTDETTDLRSFPYAKAVAAFGEAWDAALTHAKKVGQSSIPAEERKKLKTARTLLRKAENTGATRNERQLAYSRAMKILAALTTVVVPKRALAKIEQAQRPLLDATQQIPETPDANN